MIDVILAGTVIDIAQFILACGAIWLWLRLLDHSSGASFHQTYAMVRGNPLASALYLGLRFVGSALLFAAVVG